jgi:hypothetical protein
VAGVRSGPDSESGLEVSAPQLATLAARSGAERALPFAEPGRPLGIGRPGGWRGSEVALFPHAFCRAGRPGGAVGAWITDAGGDVVRAAGLFRPETAGGSSQFVTDGTGEMVDPWVLSPARHSETRKTLGASYERRDE